MLFLLKFTRWLYNSFATAMTPTQLAYGLCLGFFLAMMPWGWTQPHVLALIALVLVTRASWGLFGITAAAVKPLMLLGGNAIAWKVGHAALSAPSLQGFWRTVLDLPVIALFDFDHYQVLGGFLCALVCAAVFFFPIRQSVVVFREKVQPRADQYRLVRWWRGFFLTRALSYVFVGS